MKAAVGSFRSVTFGPDLWVEFVAFLFGSSGRLLGDVVSLRGSAPLELTAP
jgi:hypothetical protein